MDTSKKEIRVSSGKIEIRAEGDAAPVISGYAALFDTPSKEMGGFYEVCKQGCFTSVATDDVRLLVSHDDDDGPLARTTSRTLKLTVDAKGLFFEATLDPSDPDVQRLIPKVRRGDMNQCSFGFFTRKDNWLNESNGSIKRELLDVELCDVSVVTYAAYPQTSVAVRSLESFKKELQDRQEQEAAIAVAKVKVLQLHLDLDE